MVDFGDCFRLGLHSSQFFTGCVDSRFQSLESDGPFQLWIEGFVNDSNRTSSYFLNNIVAVDSVRQVDSGSTNMLQTLDCGATCRSIVHTP